MAIVAKRKGGGATTGKAPAPQQGRGALVAAVLAVAALLAWRFLGGSRPSAPAPGNVDVAPPDVATPAAIPAPKTDAVAPPATDPATASDAASAIPWPVADFPASNVQDSRPTRQPSPSLSVAEQGSVKETPRKPTPMFENQVENRLEAVSRQGFNSIVTMRVDLPQEEILEILKRPVEIYDDDDEETVAAKERTAEMKAEALKFIEAGGTFNQFLRDCQAAANEARETVRDVREEMKRILLEQGEEAAQAYLDQQNPLLREQGLEEVHIGKGLIRMMERRRAKEAEESHGH